MENAAILQNQILTASIEDDIITAAADFSREKSDAELVSLVLAGEEAAYAEIFEKYKKLVAVIAGRYFREPGKVEEIVQITFVKAYFELKEFRGKNEFSMAGWLGKITANNCLDAIKSRRRKSENLLCEFTEIERERIFAGVVAADNAENMLIERDLAEKLLAHLPVADRALLEMLFVEELSVQQIAEITGKSKANVKIRAFRARIALRKVLRKLL